MTQTGAEPEKDAKTFVKKRASVKELVREPTAGGVLYRIVNGTLEILLIQDALDRWTIPKGHIEEGETAQETAIREMQEEAGVSELEPMGWLGKVRFNYRREETLVMITQQVYLFKVLGDTNDIQKEEWMNGIGWHSYEEAVKLVEYEDIKKLIARGKQRLEQRGEI
ncbi:MAG: NUDIX domain-containing protein [Candidatus Nomurabacteria bacterium]|jgi:diadenosine hexaphosphate hydrolase (ATP-forming)|nr:NUDIX domain-containing protein [Candidatus Nomurabacteria bacterium]